MQTVSLTQEKEQTVTVTLSGQQCKIRLVQRESGLYMDLTVGDTVLFQGVPCWYANKMVRYSYLGFSGDLVFMDNQGQSDPSYDGLGTRYPLYYLEASEIV